MITADTITDAQIEALRELSSEHGEGQSIGDEHYSAAVMLNLCDEALGDFDYGDRFVHLSMAKALVMAAERRQWSRARCAEILNARLSCRKCGGLAWTSGKNRKGEPVHMCASCGIPMPRPA